MDSGRKDLSTKASEKVTPDSSKSTLDKVKEGVTNTGDKVAREGVPDSEKSTGQKLADSTGREKDHNKSGGGGVIDKTKDALGMNK